VLKKINNENGQATVEFFLILPLFVVVMLFLMLVYELLVEITTVQQNVRFEMRTTVEKEWETDFHAVEEEEDVFVKLTGAMKAMLGYQYIKKLIIMKSYAGCYPGLKKNIYRLRHRHRQI
jgi:hypothetical protein